MDFELSPELDRMVGNAIKTFPKAIDADVKFLAKQGTMSMGNERLACLYSFIDTEAMSDILTMIGVSVILGEEFFNKAMDLAISFFKDLLEVEQPIAFAVVIYLLCAGECE